MPLNAPALFLAIVLLQAPLLAATQSSVAHCCAALSASIGASKVFYPNTARYNRSSTSYFAQQEGDLNPNCYVKPSNTEDVSIIVTTLFRLNREYFPECPFAVKGGGHHTVIGIANIHHGITIDLENINQTILSSDKTIARVGSGARWGSVYSTLVPEGLAVLGGRESGIGVGGFTTGGGISYFGAEYGFGCDLVSNFEIVLADGSIRNVNARENPSLFKALKGGSNNFGIVTRFDLKTFELGQYFGGSIFYLGSQSPALIDAFSAFTSNPDFDNRAGMFVSIIYTSSEGFITACTFSYTEPIEEPPVFVNFTSKIPILLSETSVANLSYFADTLGGANTPDNLRQTSITTTVKPVESLLQEIYLLWNATIPLIISAENLVVSLTMQPLAVNFLNAGPLNGGNSLGLSSSGGPLVVLTLTVQYTSRESDELIVCTTRELFRKIDDLAEEEMALNAWKYLNYADITQDVIASYGVANAQRLMAVSRSVDPTGFFQWVQPGGFKVLKL